MYQAPWQKRLDNLAENHGHCEFIGALLAPLIASVLPEAVAGATILGTAVPEVIGGALGSAAIGAGISGITGGNPLLGALGGGLSGAVGAFGPALGAATGIGTVGGDILAGVGGGLLSSEITGTSPLTGALTGGATGAISGVLSPAATAAGGAAGTTPGQGGSAAATAVPAGGGATASGSGTAAAFGDLSSTSALGTGGLLNAPGGTGSSVSGTPGAVTGGGGNISGGGGAPSTVGTVSSTTSSASSVPATTSGGSFLGNLFGGGGGTSYPGWAAGTGAGAGIYTNLATGVTSDVPGASIPAGMSTAATGAGGGILDTLKGDISKFISSPTALLAGGLLGYEMLSGGLSNNTAADQALQQQATAAASTATELQAPLTSGVLPTGAQSALDLSRQNMEASARSTYASMGMGDSTGQSDAFQAIAQQIAAEKVGIEESLFAQAGPYAQLASSDDIAILNQQRAEDQQFTSALTSFVAALAGSKSGTPAVA